MENRSSTEGCTSNDISIKREQNSLHRDRIMTPLERRREHYEVERNVQSEATHRAFQLNEKCRTRKERFSSSSFSFSRKSEKNHSFSSKKTTDNKKCCNFALRFNCLLKIQSSKKTCIVKMS